jgi:sarcosine/dimethylglycine N-methyltransferase
MIDKLEEKIIHQYSSLSGQLFYRYVMGDDSDHTHYGMYLSEHTSMKEALILACKSLLQLTNDCLLGSKYPHPTKEPTTAQPFQLLDLGSGTGGPAQYILTHTSWDVLCVDLCARSLDRIEQWAKVHQLSDRLSTWCGSFQSLPEDYTASVDIIWSQDVLCHASNRQEVFLEAYRILKTNGVMIFSDILLNSNAPRSLAEAFTGLNQVQNLGSYQQYLNELRLSGFKTHKEFDWSSFFPINFMKMLSQIRKYRSQMLNQGVDPQLISRFEMALQERLKWEVGEVLEWRAFATYKRNST